MSRTAQASTIGFLTGAATGFVLGLLLAPDEGRELRRRVAYLMDRWSGDLARAVDRLDGSGRPDSYARDRAEAVVADARQQAEALLNEADALMKQARGPRD